MRKKKQKRAYSKRAHREHPGVTISEEGGRIVLRWREPAPGGRTGKRKKEVVVDANGRPVPSRTAAHSYAVKKAEEIARERAALANIDAHLDEFKPNTTWAELFLQHKEHLQRKGRSPKTVKDYQQSWPFVESWRSRPSLPKQLTVRALEEFTAHVSRRKHFRTGEDLSPHSVAAVLRHFKGLLNYGRKRLKCVRLDGETVAEGLKPIRRGEVKPVALSTSKLKAILQAAVDYDGKHPDSAVFPLLAFIMLTGCRVGEVESLRWKPAKPGALESWIDFEGGRVVCYGSKTYRQRVIPLNTRPALRSLLETLRSATDTDMEPFVFGGKLKLALRDKRQTFDEPRDNSERIIGRSLKSAVYAVRAASGADWSPKDLRSTLATFLCNSNLGMNLYEVAGWMGHDYAVLVKHYAGQFILPDEQRHAGTVEGVLGVTRELAAWQSSREEQKGRLLGLERRR